jgi:outer membrane protein TolC
MSMKYCFLWLPMLLSGCMTSLPEQPIEQWSDSLIRQELDGETAKSSRDTLENRFTFDEAISRAVSVSPELRSNEYALLLARIDARQARSEIWPRFSLEGQYEVALENPDPGPDGNADDHGFRGGLRIDYDLTKTLFQRDLLTAAAIKRQRAVIQAHLIYTQLSGKLLSQVVELQVAKEKIETLAHTLAALRQEQQTIKSIAGIKGLQVAGNWHIDDETHKYERLKRTAMSQLARLSREVKQTLGVSAGNEVEITDLETVLSRITGRYPAPQDFSEQLAQSLRQRADVRLAVLDIMTSVLHVRRTEIERLPHVGLGLGYGDFDLLSSGQTTGAIAMVKLSMPLFDFGDLKRKHEAAQINEQRARDEFHSISRSVDSDLRTAIDNAQSAKIDYEEAVSWNQRSQQRMQQIDDLYKSRQIDRKDRLQAVISATATQLDMLDAKLRWYSAAISLATARADELFPSPNTHPHEQTPTQD